MTADLSGEAPLSELLEEHRDALARFLQREAQGLLRFEGIDDLVQGVHLKALKGEDRFRWEGEKAFIGWLFQLARQHIADVNAHWKALKRNAGPVLRVTLTGGDSASGALGVQPIASITGPLTFAARREHFEVAMRALATLPERDRLLIERTSRGATIEELSAELDLSYEAAQKARRRALQRFQQAFRVLSP